MGSNFLQQFMAGWQMGQGRNENQRRDQELQMEQARQKQEEERRAAMFQLQQEEFKLRKKQLAAEEHASRLEAAKEAFRMRTEAASMQGLPAPTAADVGIPEQGPEMAGPPAAQVSVPQPTMAMPNPMEGQPDISMPVLTGQQQRMMAQAAQQRKMQEALGMKVAEAQALEPFEERKFKREAGLKRELAGQKTKQMQALLGSFGTAKSEGQQKSVENAQFAIAKMPSWQKFINENEGRFGFYAGRKTMVEQSGALRPFGVKPSAEVATFDAELATLTTSIMNALSGAAISPQEAKRMERFIPQLKDEPEVVKAKMATLDDFFKFRLTNFKAPYQGPGWQKEAPAPGAASPAAPGVNPLLVQYGIEIFAGDQ